MGLRFIGIPVPSEKMTKHEKLLRKILEEEARASISFKELRNLLLRLGFVERIRGGHHLFRHPELGIFLNLQSAGSEAKPYQVKQVRVAIMKLQEGDTD